MAFFRAVRTILFGLLFYTLVAVACLGIVMWINGAVFPRAADETKSTRELCFKAGWSKNPKTREWQKAECDRRSAEGAEQTLPK
jgi:hypothetical protein